MRRLIAGLVITAALAAGFAGPVLAQTTTGLIDGVVRGPDGEALPGVTVIARSPALIRSEVMVTSDAQGYFRIPLLPPGSYTVVMSLQGFRQFTEESVIVEVTKTTTVNVELELGGITETTTVTGTAPNIDPRSAKLAFNVTQDLAENTPTDRTLDGLLATVPGVTSIDNFGSIGPGVFKGQNVLGAGERANSFRLDGGDSTDPAGQWNQQQILSYDAIAEVQVLKSAKPAEAPYQGGLFNVITKSGGNELSGTVSAYFADDALQASNSGDLPAGTASNQLVRQFEINASLGGPIARDKAWWFASARLLDDVSRTLGFEFSDIDNDALSLLGKITYQFNDDHRIAFTGSHWDQDVSHYFFGYSPTLALNEEASAIRPLRGTTIGARWSGILSDTVLAEANFNYSAQGFDQVDHPTGGVAIVDLVTGRRANASGVGTRNQTNDLWSIGGSISWFIPEAAGRHDIKAGFEYRPTSSDLLFREPGDHRLHTVFGQKRAVRFLTTPSRAVWNNDQFSLYAQDAWQVNDRLTLNLGLRFMNLKAGSPEQQVSGGAWAGTPVADRFPLLNGFTVPKTEMLDWNTLEPRLAAAYSLSEDGRTVLRAGMSRYYQNLPSFELFISNPAFPVNIGTLWFDRNNDFAFQPGEDGPLIFQFGGALNTVDPDIKRPHTDEFVLGISHEPVRDVQLSANAIYRKDRNITNAIDAGVPFSAYSPVDVVDPGPDGVIGTGDDGTLTVYAQDPDTIGDSRSVLTNPDGNDRTYKGLELTASKRLSNRWQGVASLILSEMQVIKSTSAGSDGGIFDSPNGLINAEGLDTLNTTWQIKLQGSYFFDFGLVLSGFFDLQSGLPYTRQLGVTGLPQGAFTVFAEPRGSSKTDTSAIFDLRLEQQIDVSAGRFGLVAEVFNLFNASPVLAYGTITGVDYGDPAAIATPRVVRLGARYSW